MLNYERSAYIEGVAAGKRAADTVNINASKTIAELRAQQRRLISDLLACLNQMERHPFDSTGERGVVIKLARETLNEICTDWKRSDTQATPSSEASG